MSSPGLSPVQAQPVEASLYKLLLYKEGGHFDWHQDTEKRARMFGTLSVQLPSRFTGGAYRVRQAGQTKFFRLEPYMSTLSNEPSDIKFVAHYADCEHKVDRVESGHRLVLVYALCRGPVRALPPLQRTIKHAWRLCSI